MLLLRQLTPFLERLAPAWFHRWVMEMSPVRNVRRTVQITDALYERSLEIFRTKKAALEAGEDTDSKDIMSILRAYTSLLRKRSMRDGYTYSTSEHGGIGRRPAP